MRGKHVKKRWCSWRGHRFLKYQLGPYLMCLRCFVLVEARDATCL